MRVAGATIGSRGIALLAATAAVGIVLGVHGWSSRHHGTAPGRSHASGSAAPTPGPRLSRQSYASYSYRVWPGPVSPAAKAAGTGLAISIRRHGSGIMVTAGVVGQPAQPARFYPTGTAVYVVEAAMGDDSGNADYNLGDDGLVVTDSHGRVLE
jgi:hypothetical protein